MTDYSEKRMVDNRDQSNIEPAIADSITEKPHRTTEMQLGDTTFTIISVESDRARERLYDKVKRLILDSDTPVNANASLPT